MAFSFLYTNQRNKPVFSKISYELRKHNFLCKLETAGHTEKKKFLNLNKYKM